MQTFDLNFNDVNQTLVTKLRKLANGIESGLIVAHRVSEEADPIYCYATKLGGPTTRVGPYMHTLRIEFTEK